MTMEVNGIRVPDNPLGLADLIKFLTEIAEDVGDKYASKAGSRFTGSVASPHFVATAGGAAQSSYVFRTADSGGFDFYDDNLKLDGSPGRRLWVAGPNGSDIVLAARYNQEKLNNVTIKAESITLDSSVNITGSVNVGGLQTIRRNFEDNVILSPNTFAANNQWTKINTGFTFVTPPAGQVIIHYGAMLPARNKQVALSYQIRQGGIVGQGNIVLPTTPWTNSPQPPPHSVAVNGMSNEAGQWVSTQTTYFTYNLSAGQTYNVEQFYVNENTMALNLYRSYFVITPDI